MNPILEKVELLNRQLETKYLALAVALVELKESQAYLEVGYPDFTNYYQEALGREKSTVSRLLFVGEWLRNNNLGLPEATVGYKKLGNAIKAFPNETPEKILAIAETWTPSDFKEEKKEDGHDHQYHEFCSICWKKR